MGDITRSQTLLANGRDGNVTIIEEFPSAGQFTGSCLLSADPSLFAVGLGPDILPTVALTFTPPIGTPTNIVAQLYVTVPGPTSQFVLAVSESGITAGLSLLAGSIDPTLADAASALTVESQSGTLGLRFPLGTTSEINAISAPTEGLSLFDTTLHTLSLYNGSSWLPVTTGGPYLPLSGGTITGELVIAGDILGSGGLSFYETTGMGTFNPLALYQHNLLIDADYLLWRGTGLRNIGDAGGGNPLNITLDGTIGVGDVKAATTLGTVVDKEPLYTKAGVLRGYVSIYDTIT